MIIPDATRETIAHLYFIEQMSPYDIAMQLNIPVADVSACADHLTKIRDIIRNGLLDKITAALGIYSYE